MPRVSVALRQPKVDHVDFMAPRVGIDTAIDRQRRTQCEVGWLNVAMDQVVHVHHVDPFQHLIRQLQRRFQAKPPPTFREKLLQRRSQKVQDHGEVVTIRTKIVHIAHAHTIRQLPVHFTSGVVGPGERSGGG